MADPIHVNLREGEKVPISVVLKKANGDIDTSYENDSWAFEGGTTSVAGVSPNTGLAVEVLGNSEGVSELVFEVDSDAGEGSQPLKQSFFIHVAAANAITIESTVGEPVPQ